MAGASKRNQPREITLKFPEDNWPAKLTMRPPKAKDQVAAQKLADNAGDSEIMLFATLCDSSPDIIGELEMFDYIQLQETYADFLEGKPSPGGKSSGA